MKIPNYSYRKVTCCKTNNWKSGGKHLPIFQVFPDISVSLTHKQTPPRQIYLVLTQMMYQRFWAWLHECHIILARISGGPSLSGSIQAATYPRLSKCWWGGGWRWGCNDEEDYRKSQEFTSQALLSLQSWGDFLPHCFHPYFNIYGLYLMGVELCKF